MCHPFSSLTHTGSEPSGDTSLDPWRSLKNFLMKLVQAARALAPSFPSWASPALFFRRSRQGAEVEPLPEAEGSGRGTGRPRTPKPLPSRPDPRFLGPGPDREAAGPDAHSRWAPEAPAEPASVSGAGRGLATPAPRRAPRTDPRATLAARRGAGAKLEEGGRFGANVEVVTYWAERKVGLVPRNT